MDFFSEKIFDKYDYSSLVYVTKRGFQSESLCLTFSRSDDDPDKLPDRYFITKDAPFLSSWMEILDYDVPGKDLMKKGYEVLKQLYDVFELDKADDDEKLRQLVSKADEKRILDMGKSALKILKDATKLSPIFFYIYTEVFSLITDYKFFYEDSDRKEAYTRSIRSGMKSLKESIDSLPVLYEKTRGFCSDIFLIDGETKYKVDTHEVYTVYQNFCKETGKEDFYSTPILESSKRAYTRPDGVEEFFKAFSWDEFYVKEFSEDDYSYGLESRAEELDSIEDYFKLGIQYMFSSGSVIRKCKLCGNYFRPKYYSSQDYCSRIYKNTTAPCNEYASRQSYKKRYANHPLNKEYTKAYNRYYGRVRRGVENFSSEIVEGLQNIHNDYLEKYENAKEADKEAILQEYIQKTKEFLG